MIINLHMSDKCCFETSNLPTTLRLGKLHLDAPFFQAALSGYTDRAMRSLAREFGCPLTFAGVMLDKITLSPKALKKPVFQVGDDEHPIGGQLLGSDPDMMAHAAGVLQDVGYDLIDLNFGCPAPKVLNRGRGGQLLNTPRQALAIIDKVRARVSCPLLIKLRIGASAEGRDREAFRDIALRAAEAGVDAMIVHGRTVDQRYRGRADWETLAELKRSLKGTVIIGSGDLFCGGDIVARLSETGLDGAAVARGAIGNPWIFPETRALLGGKRLPDPPGLAEQGHVVRDHFERVLALYEPRKAVIYFRKFIVRYLKRHPQRKQAQTEMIVEGTVEGMGRLLQKWYPLT